MIIIKGDVNLDGKVDIQDLMWFELHRNGDINLRQYPMSFLAADIDGDGALTNDDYNRIARHISAAKIITQVVEIDGAQQILQL